MNLMNANRDSMGRMGSKKGGLKLEEVCNATRTTQNSDDTAVLLTMHVMHNIMHTTSTYETRKYFA